MISPLENHQLLILDEVSSTQEEAARLLTDEPTIGAVLALQQTKGRGRFNRLWYSVPGDSLTCSYIFRSQAGHSQPHLLGMALAVAAAGVIHCQLKWPNDLIIEGKKVGGILTELFKDPQGRSVAVTGIGINLNQKEFPLEISDRAVSLFQAHGRLYEAQTVAEEIDDRLQLLPEVQLWEDLRPSWEVFDATPGTKYRQADGTELRALAIGSEGQLIAEIGGETSAVYAADAILSGS